MEKEEGDKKLMGRGDLKQMKEAEKNEKGELQSEHQKGEEEESEGRSNQSVMSSATQL